MIDSRSAEAGAVIRRRRECVSCSRRFTTYERVERIRRLAVIKRDGSRDHFVAEKILAGIHAACGKRPIPEDVKTKIADQVEDELYREYEHEVPSAEIGRRVAARLRGIDPIAYIRYASEYHEFRNLDELIEEAQSMQASPPQVASQRDLFE